MTATEPTGQTPEHDVKAIFRRTNRIFAAGLFVLAAIGIAGVIYSASGRAASRDSYNATAVALANQERSVCITTRRNAELAAIGDKVGALGRAQIAALLHDDLAEAERQVLLFEEASQRRHDAVESLSPQVIDLPPSQGGCGPPILTLDDLDDARP